MMSDEVHWNRTIVCNGKGCRTFMACNQRSNDPGKLGKTSLKVEIDTAKCIPPPPGSQHACMPLQDVAMYRQLKSMQSSKVVYSTLNQKDLESFNPPPST